MKYDPIFLNSRMLEVFCAVAEELHFGRAALRLSMSQPPLSQQIKRLEAQIGVDLFVRSTRTVRLTPAGKVLYQRALHIAETTKLMLRATRQAGRGEGGLLTVGLIPSVAGSPLVEALYRYRTAHPEVEIELLEQNSNTMEGPLRMRSIDVALMRPTPMEADMDSIEVFSEPIVLAVRSDHPLAAHPEVTLEQIADLPMIGYAQAISPYFRQKLANMFSSIGKRPYIVQESVLPTILTLVEAGVGAALVPWTISRGKFSALTFIPLKGAKSTQASIVLSFLRERQNPIADGFIQAMQNLD